MLDRLIRKTILAVTLATPLLASPSPVPANEHTLEVVQFVLARGVFDREPVQVTESFGPNDSSAYAYARVANTGEPATLIFVWRRAEEVHSVYTTTIGTSPGWRVWSLVTLQPGPWRVDLVTESGKVIASRSFFME